MARLSGTYQRLPYNSPWEIRRPLWAVELGEPMRLVIDSSISLEGATPVSILVLP